MRSLVAALVIVVGAFVLATPAIASCAPPAPLPERTARAVAVVYGSVTATDMASLTLRVDRSLKGQLAGAVRVFVGPGRGGVAGTAVATSIDYRASVGTDHVLYVIRGDDGALETNACIGSHAGAPDADEIAFFGSISPGAPAVSPQPGSAPDAAPPSVRVELAGVLLAAALLAGVTALLLRRRIA